jgi:hypothetical protein
LQQTVFIIGRLLRVRISCRAAQRRRRREVLLYLEMELYFSCLLRKQVNVREQPDGIEAHPVNDRLQVCFRPVVTKSCAISECPPGKPPVTDMPVVRPERYFPHWLKLDYRAGRWLADFGYACPRAD